MSDLKKKSPDDAAQLEAKGLARWENEGGAPVSGDRSSAEKANYASRDPIRLAKHFGVPLSVLDEADHELIDIWIVEPDNVSHAHGATWTDVGNLLSHDYGHDRRPGYG